MLMVKVVWVCVIFVLELSVFIVVMVGVLRELVSCCSCDLDVKLCVGLCF